MFFPPLLNTLNINPVCYTTTYSITICPRRFAGNKMYPFYLNSKYRQSSIAFNQTVITLGVLPTSQI